MKLSLFLLLFAAQASAESRWTKPLRWSWAALSAATVADCASSYGHPEANPLLAGRDGRFGVKAVAIKGAVIGGVIGIQYLLHRRHPKSDKAFTIVNFAAAGVTTGAAVRNWRMENHVR